MEQTDTQLNDLIVKGKTQGYLTYDEVNSYLPDEDVSPEKLDELLLALDERGIELLDEAPKDEFEDEPVAKAPTAEEVQAVQEAMPQLPTAVDLPKLSDDPIRMYLSQMAEIPLLTREQEISLAKKIEVTRKRFRRSVLTCDFALRQTVETLKKVYKGYLPFDRTIKVSLTERLTKEQIQARMPHNLKTLERLMDENRKDFSLLINKLTPSEVDENRLNCNRVTETAMAAMMKNFPSALPHPRRTPMPE